MSKSGVMNITHRLQEGYVSTTDLVVAILRIALGIVILLKGIFFLSHSEYLGDLIRQTNFELKTQFWISYIAFAHLFGGVFIILGLITRFAVALQIPVLIGAVVFVNPAQGSQTSTFEMVLAIAVLILLVFFLIKGPGKVSMDEYLKKYLL